MGSQTENGRAFEWAVGKEISKQLKLGILNKKGHYVATW